MGRRRVYFAVHGIKGNILHQPVNQVQEMMDLLHPFRPQQLVEQPAQDLRRIYPVDFIFRSPV